MKFARYSNTFLVIRYVLTGMLAIAFVVHFYFLWLAKYSIADTSSNMYLIALQKKSAESQVDSLTKEYTFVNQTNAYAAEVFEKLTIAHVDDQAKFNELFKQVLLYMSEGDYTSAALLLHEIDSQIK